MMRHKGCGGPILESVIVYYQDPDDPKVKHPALYCAKCYVEVGSDDDIELEDEPTSPHS